MGTEHPPTCWPARTLGELLQRPLAYGVLKPGDFVPDGVPLVRIQDVHTRLLDPAQMHRISPTLHSEFRRTELRGGELLFSVVGTLGKVVEVPTTLAGANISRALCVIGPGQEVLGPFLKQVLASTRVQSWVSREGRGNAQAVLNLGLLRELRVPVPPIDEQQKIAAILSSVDDVIEKAEAVISQLRVVKKAMMQKLLTCGLPGRHTQFKRTEIGEAPEDWKVCHLEELAEVQTGIAKGKQPKGATIEIPYLRVANVQDGYVDLTEMKTLVVEPTALQRYGLRPGDVLFTEGGDADKLGRGCVWRGQIEPCLHQNHVFAVRPNADQVLPDFLAQYAASTRGKAYFLDCAKQTTNLASINSTQLKAMPITVPHLDEQAGIVRVLATIDDRVEAERRVVRAQRDLKGALSAALLSGEVRVNVDQEVAA